jgi:DNA-binding NarL/FixJ family response regulator
MTDALPESTQVIRVLLAEDHTLVREGIKQFLNEASDIEIVGEAADGAQAVRLVQSLTPHVAVMDINMPKVTGVEATRRIKQHFPHVRVPVLTAYGDDPYIRALLRAGADGYVLKTARGKAYRRLAPGTSGVDSPEPDDRHESGAPDDRRTT